MGYVEDNSEIIDVDGTLWYKGNLYTLGQTADYENPDNIDPDKLLYGEHYVFAKTAEAVEAFGSEYPGLNTESWAEVEWDDFTEGGAPEEAEEETGTLSSKTLSREQAISAAHKLRDLKDLGIMTPEEFEQIKARLYSRLG